MGNKLAVTKDPSSPQARATRLHYVRKHLLGQSREQFCGETRDFVTPQTLKSWELAWGNGLTEKGANQVAKRARALGMYCTAAWLLHGIGREATPLTKDLEQSGSHEEQIARELLTFRDQANTIDTIISDDAMLPFLYPGNYVGGIIVDDMSLAIDKDCIIIGADDHLYVRILKYGDEPGRYHLVSLNPNPNFAKKEIKNMTIKQAAPIVWVRRRNPKE